MASREFRVAVGAVSTTVVSVMPVFLVGGLAVQISRDLHLTPATLGLAVTVYFGVTAFGSLPVGALVGRYGPARTARAAVALAAATMCVIAVYPPSRSVLFLMLALAATANSLGQLATNASLGRSVPADRQGILFGLKQAAIPLATLLAGASVPAIALRFGWRWAFGAGAALALVALALVPPDGLAARRHREERRPAGTGLLILGVAAALGAAAATTISSFLVDSTVSQGLSEARAGLVLTLGGALCVACRVGLGWLADRRARGHLMLVAVVLAGGAGGVALLGAGTPAALVLGVCLAYGMGWSWPGLLTFAVVRLRPAAPAAATSITQTGVYAGASAGPLLFGLIVAHGGYPLAWTLDAAVMALAAGMTLLGSRLTATQRVAGSPVDANRAAVGVPSDTWAPGFEPVTPAPASWPPVPTVSGPVNGAVVGVPPPVPVYPAVPWYPAPPVPAPVYPPAHWFPVPPVPPPRAPQPVAGLGPAPEAPGTGTWWPAGQPPWPASPPGYPAAPAADPYPYPAPQGYHQLPGDPVAPVAVAPPRHGLDRPATRPARTGVRAALRRGTLGWVRVGPGSREQAIARDEAELRRDFAAPRQVTVVNPKGGAGKTVAVLLLAMTFGHTRGGPVLAWDNNETQGTLGLRSQHNGHARTVRDLLRDLPYLWFAGPGGDLRPYVRSQGQDMFDVLASDESTTAEDMLTAAAFGELRWLLSRFYPVMMVDTGNNVRAQNWQAAIDVTDQLVVTMSARNDSAETAARMLDHLEQLGHDRLVRQAVTVVSMPPGRTGVDVPEVVRYFAGRTRAVLPAPYDRAVDTGAPLRYGQLSGASQLAWLRVAAEVARGLPGATAPPPPRSW